MIVPGGWKCDSRQMPNCCASATIEDFYLFFFLRFLNDKSNQIPIYIRLKMHRIPLSLSLSFFLSFYLHEDKPCPFM